MDNIKCNKIDLFKEIIKNDFFSMGSIVIFIWKNEKDWPIINVTKNIEKIFGYKYEDIINSKIIYSKMIHPDDLKIIKKETVLFSKSNLNSFEYTPYRIKNSSEEYRWVQEQTIALRDKNKNITHFIGYILDITKNKLVEEELIRSKSLLNEAQKIAQVGSWSLDIPSNRLFWSDEIYRIFDINPDKFNPSYEGFLNSIHPDDIEMVNKAFKDSIKNKTPYSITHRLLMKNGEIKYVQENGITEYGKKGEPVFSQGTIQDITKLKLSEKKLTDFVKMIDENIITSSTDLEGNIIDVSEAFCCISGYEKWELIGKNHAIIRHKNSPKKLYEKMWNTILENKTWEGELKNSTKSGNHYWVHAKISPTFDENGKKIGYISIQHDITDKKRVEILSITDNLTGLFNRLKLDEVFAKEFAFSKRYGDVFSIVIIDLDRFKSINDTFGHQIGDKVLIDFAKILKNNSRELDIVGRWGGEEFLIILPKTDKNGALKLAEHLREKTQNHEFEIAGNVTASFGVSQLVEGDTQQSIIERADFALYKAKQKGRNRVDG